MDNFVKLKFNFNFYWLEQKKNLFNPLFLFFIESMYINIHTHKTLKSLSILEVYNLNKTFDLVNEKFSVGIHPWYINENKISENLAELNLLITNKNCLALGECGLDKSISINLEFQKQVFVKQLNLNKVFSKPVILHCVRAYQETLDIIKAYDYFFIFHAFNKGEILAKQIQEQGAYLSFGKALLTNAKAQATLKACEVSQIFFETDNDDISIEIIYETAAKLLNLPLEKLKSIILQNYKTVFNGNT